MAKSGITALPFESNAFDVADDLLDAHGNDAIVGAQAALRRARVSGHQNSISLWQDTCFILKRRLVIAHALN